MANYPTILTQNVCEKLVRKGPIQVITTFPSKSGRSFSASYYTKQLPNREKIKRDWLIYSKKLDAIHCFCCKIFGQKSFASGFASENGFNDWNHLSIRIKEHEFSKEHFQNYTKWKTLCEKISTQATIGNMLFNQFQKEKQRLRMVFQRYR